MLVDRSECAINTAYQNGSTHIWFAPRWTERLSDVSNYITFYDLQGRQAVQQVLPRHQSTHQIDISALLVGIYVYTFTDTLGGIAQRGKVVLIW